MKTDQLLKLLAAFTQHADLQLSAATERHARVALMDTLAVSLGALSHPAAQAARKYARHSQVVEGASLWGSGLCVTAETAALVNGVPLRAYDYNDLYMGKGGGHPSDMIPGLVAVAEWRRLDGKVLLGAIALGYEICLNLFDHIRPNDAGFDYPNIVAIGATCAAARMLGLSEGQTREAISITVMPHLASDEAESNELNARGDLTMWKRFNGSDAIRQSVYACLLSEAGAEGIVRPFEGRHGFLAKMRLTPEDIPQLYATLENIPTISRIDQITYKRWPVGSRGQSAIRAALEARAGIADITQIDHIRVFTDESVYDHLVRQRSDPWNPISRETADHSLPCIVATAILDGEIGTATFDPERVLDPARRTLLNDKLTVEVSEEITGGMKTGFMSRIEITDKSGNVSVGQAQPAPGHRLQPFTDHDFETKFKENVAPLFGAQRAEDLIKSVWTLESADDVVNLCQLCVLDEMRKTA